MARFVLAVVLVVIVSLYWRLDALAAPGQHLDPPAHVDGAADLLLVLAPQQSVAERDTADEFARRYRMRVRSHWWSKSLARHCYVFRAPSPAEAERARAEVAADPRVESAQAVQTYTVAATRRIDPYINLQHSFTAARIDESHQISTGKDVKIAIIDTGLDRGHADLRGQIDTVLNFVDADQSVEVVEFHATAVAGIIGAIANNGRGIVGIAPDAAMFSLRACWESIPGTSRGQCNSVALARALDWAIANDIKIVNMSLQGEYDPIVSRLIIRAVQQGLVVVAATELHEGQLSFPASMTEVIGVSYHDTSRAIDTIRYAGKVFIAPGEEILTTMPDNTYDFVTGSSFASAHITGVVALLAERVPTIDAHTTKAVLRSSTRIANWAVLVDACTALATVTGAENCRPYPPRSR